MDYAIRFMLGLLVLLVCWSVKCENLIQQIGTEHVDNVTTRSTGTDDYIKKEDEKKINVKLNKSTDYKPKTDSTSDKQKFLANKLENLNLTKVKLEKSEPYKKEVIDDKKNRENVAKSIDIDKYVSESFRNNVYNLPTSPDTEKFINSDSHDSYDLHSTTISYLPEDEKDINPFSLDLTTPKSSFFDNKYKEAVRNIDQTWDHFDNLSSEDDSDFDKIQENHKNNTKLFYKNFKNIVNNNTNTKNSLKNDLIIESGTNLNFQSSFNNTEIIDENPVEEQNKIKKKEPEEHENLKGDIEKTEVSTVRNFVLTTRKNTVLRKSTSNNNNSHILSNKIEIESVKANNPIRENDDESTTKLPLFDLTKRGTTKYADYLTTTILPPPTTTTIKNKLKSRNKLDSLNKINKTEQLVQENQIIPIHVEPPVITTSPSVKTTSEIITNKIMESTTMTISETTMPIETTFTTDSTPTTPSITAETEISTKAVNVEATASETTAGTETTTVAETTAATEKMTVAKTTRASEITTILEETTTEMPATETVFSTEHGLRTSKSIVFSSKTTVEESENITELMDKVEITTEMSETVKMTKLPTTARITTKSVERTSEGTTIDYDEIDDIFKNDNRNSSSTTEVVFVNIESIGRNNTTLLPDVFKPKQDYPSPDIIEPIDNRIHKTTFDENTTQSSIENDELTNDSNDNSGTIAAIVISSVGGLCLILLAGLLIIMRKRQKRFNYGQRCRPVSLDDYSMDNISVHNSLRRKGAIRASKRSYGNPAFDDPISISNVLNFPALGKFANNFEGIRCEFEEIPQITARTNELPEGCDVKNRYANVIPLPETRVFLTPIDGYPNSDYINANYVTGPKNTKGYYIACQAPMENTVDDFWRMIWEQQTKVILMLTQLFENRIEKCFDYLPPSEVLDCHRLFGDFQVTLKKREVKEKYIISSLQLKNMVSNSWREVTHFWYLGWPEKGVPTEANSLIAFLIEARSYMKSSSIDRKQVTNGDLNSVANNETSPVVVHCSPGTGRTGVVIACDIAIREFEQSRVVDVPRIVYKIRRDRANSVQTKDQYAFIYKIINLYATKLTGGALDSL